MREQEREQGERQSARAAECESGRDPPVLHAGQLGGGLLQGDVVSVGEGAQAAGDEGHGAEARPGGAARVGAGGAAGLAAVPVAVPRRLQVVVGAGEGHLHACSPVELKQAE